MYVSNIFQNGHTQPWGGVVWLVVDSVHAVDRGNFKVDLTRALDDVADLLQTHYAWSNVRNRYYLDTLQFGVEYGGLDADLYGSPPAKFSLNLSSYCLHLATTVANAGKC